MGVRGRQERGGAVAHQIIGVRFCRARGAPRLQPLQRIIAVRPILRRNHLIQDGEKIFHSVVGIAERCKRPIGSNRQGRLAERQYTERLYFIEHKYVIAIPDSQDRVNLTTPPRGFGFAAPVHDNPYCTLA